MERSLLRGLAAFRWAGWAWMATVLLLARRSLEHPLPAVALVVLALAVTVRTTTLLRVDPDRLTHPTVVGTELLVGVSLLLADGYVYDTEHVFSSEQPLGVAWPLAAVLSAGVAFGARVGGLSGLGFGIARATSSIAAVGGELTPAQALSLVSTTVLYALAGATAGYLVRLLRRAEREVSLARAREEVARTLHDGVLQTLAIVERRATDPDLTRLARDQERELRTFLFGTDARMVGRGDLGDALRGAADRVERAYGLRVQVLVPDDLPTLPAAACDALVGAAGEALTNAGKHAAARSATVFVEPDEDAVSCSVRDDGDGFDVANVPEGVGLTSSIRGRLAEVGGRAELDSRPGRGTEVRLWVPVRTPREASR